MKTQDLIIIGGGIMGQMTVYSAAKYFSKITILDKSLVGNRSAGSSGTTRSIRSDYTDPTYAQMAEKSKLLWLNLQKYSEENFYYPCGVVNLVSSQLTPQINSTYAAKSFAIMQEFNIQSSWFNKQKLQKSFPQFSANFASLDQTGGLLYIPTIQKTLRKLLQNKVTIIENIQITKIIPSPKRITLKTNQGLFKSNQLVIEAGAGTNEVLEKFNKSYQLPLNLVKPNPAMYFQVTSTNENNYSIPQLPVFAYLDIGIYGHPMILGKTKYLKIGYFKPAKFLSQTVKNPRDFIKNCLANPKKLTPVANAPTEQCLYDMTPDGDFIVGRLFKNAPIFIAGGFGGTGYKFAPLIGEILTQLIRGQKPKWDISKFTPARFIKT